MPSSERKKISVITTTFNLIKGGRKDVFIEMFKSVHGQTYPNIEHLIIDGGSKDGTIEFINDVNRQYGKKQLVVFSEQDKGITDATNKGVSRATGDYVILMPSDDYYMRDDALELLADSLERENADFACADGWWLFKDVWLCELNSFVYRHPFLISTMLGKKSLFEKYGFFDPELKLVADYDLMFRLCMQTNVKGVEVHKTLTCLRPGGISQSYKKQKLFIKETFISYRKYLNGHYRDKQLNALHFGNVYPKLISLLENRENNPNLLKSLALLKILPANKVRKTKRIKHMLENILFLHFITRPVKKALGLKKHSNSDSYKDNIHLCGGRIKKRRERLVNDDEIDK